jgi:hypothetical protein
MKFRRKVCANLWMTVEKRRAQRLRVQGSKREIRTQDAESTEEIGKIEAEKENGKRKERGCRQRG